MSQAQSHHLTPLDIGREVATEKRNLDPLAGRLVVFLHVTSPSFLIGGDSYLLEEGVIINTNLASLEHPTSTSQVAMQYSLSVACAAIIPLQLPPKWLLKPWL